MRVSKLKEILEEIPDDYIVVMENRCDGEVIEWDTMGYNKTLVGSYTIVNDLQFKDVCYDKEDGSEGVLHTVQRNGGSFILTNLK